MRLCAIRFYSGCNLVAPCSGAVLHFADIPLGQCLDPGALLSWAEALPMSLPLRPDELRSTWSVVIQRLLLMLTEQARLGLSTSRLLAEDERELSLWLPVDDADAAAAASQLVCRWLMGAEASTKPDREDLAWLHRLRSCSWNQTHAHLARAAQDLRIPFYRRRNGSQQLLQLGQGRRQRLFSETITDRTSLLAHWLHRKISLPQVLAGRGIPLPVQRVAHSLEQALEAACAIGWPVVLKPADGAKGRDVWLGLAAPEALERAWQVNGGDAHNPQLIQRQLVGDDHRVLVSGGVVMAVARRQPAEVVGDGLRSVQALLEALNADPRRGVAYELLMNRVPVDARLLELLRRQQLSLHAVPGLGQRVRLSDTANISQGGSAVDLTDAIHPDNRRMAEDVARLLGVDVIGLDVISQDLRRSWREGKTWLLEANLSPGLRPHLVADPQTDLCHRLVRQWMGGPEDTRVPTVLITGSIGKTTTTRLLAHLLEGLDWTVGITSTTGLELGRTVLAEGDCAGGLGIQHLLTDPRTDAVVAEVARGGLQKIGLVVHEADLGVVLNVLDNHIGQDGIRSRQDLLRIKSLVARAATKALILNLDDPLVMEMASLTRATKLILVSEEDSPNASRFRSHIEAGGSGALWKDGTQGRVRLFWDGAEISCFPVADWDHLTGGFVRGQVVAAAFALASAHWLGVSHSLCRRGLASFGSDPHHNPGRFQTLSTTPFRVVLCFASTSEALRDIGIWARCHVPTVGRRHILLRGGAAWSDSKLKVFGHIAAQYFDVVVCARSERLFGRGPNEVQELLRLGALEAESDCEIYQADDDLTSLPGFLKAGKDGDLLIALCLDACLAAQVIRSWLDQYRTAR